VRLVPLRLCWGFCGDLKDILTVPIAPIGNEACAGEAGPGFSSVDGSLADSGDRPHRAILFAIRAPQDVFYLSGNGV